MISTHHYEQDMEILSALFDGELQGDTARFAMKRLGHDAQWRQALGNWQLLGDTLRGEASIAAPGDFAARVAAAVSTEPARVAPALVASAASASAVPASAIPARRKWIGGAALAASVAMVAMFVARPFSQESATPPGSAATATTEFAAQPATTTTPAAVTPSAPDAVLEVGAAALAVAELPRRAGERRSRGQSQRAALRAPKRQLAVPANGIASASTSALAVVDSHQPLVPANPFHPQHAEIVSRPWPRAVLPAASSTGAFTASYGSNATSSQSFYPFEPRLPNTVDVAPAPLHADDQSP